MHTYRNLTIFSPYIPFIPFGHFFFASSLSRSNVSRCTARLIYGLAIIKASSLHGHNKQTCVSCAHLRSWSWFKYVRNESNCYCSLECTAPIEFIWMFFKSVSDIKRDVFNLSLAFPLCTHIQKYLASGTPQTWNK